jgi:hypothetical protein
MPSLSFSDELTRAVEWFERYLHNALAATASK